MGLIPGAGGTVSIPRRIGRQRAMRLALSAEPIDAATALEWGLVDSVGPGRCRAELPGEQPNRHLWELCGGERKVKGDPCSPSSWDSDGGGERC